MALTADQKHSIVRLLGWPGAVLTSTSAAYSNIVAGRLEGLDAPTEASALALVAKVTALDVRREGALDRASTKSIDNVVLNERELDILTRERKRYLRELSQLLEIGIVGGGSSCISVSV